MAPRLLSVLCVALIWAALSVFLRGIVPTPQATVLRAVEIVWEGMFVPNMVATLNRVIVGFGAALVLSIPIGIVMGTTSFGERFFDLLVVVGLTVPGLMWALIAIMLFGLSPASPVFAVAITVLPMLVVNIWQGVKTLDRDLIDMSTAYRVSPWAKLRHVILPHIAPHMLAATRYGVGLAWKVIVVVEMFGTSNGIGFQLQSAYQGYDMTGVLAWTLAFVLVMLLLEYGILAGLERRINRWRPRAMVWRR